MNTMRIVCIYGPTRNFPCHYVNVFGKPWLKYLRIFRILQASEALRQTDIYEVIDPGMGHATVDEVESFFEIAFMCVKHKSKNRPEMQEVAGRLRELQQLVVARMIRNEPL